MNAIHVVRFLSKYCSSRSLMSAALLKLVSAAEIMVRTTFQPISSGTFLSFFSKPVHFWIPAFLVNLLLEDTPKKKEAQWPIGYGVGLRIKRSSVRIRPWLLRWVLGQGSLLPLSQGEAFTLASISFLAILVKYILAKKSLIGWSYRTARGSISTSVGLKMGNSALVLSTIHLLPLFQLWPKLRTSDSRVRLNSSLPHNFVDKGPVSIHLFSQFHWGDSLLVPDGLDELVPLLFWHLYCSSSAFCLSFCGFSCLYALAHSVNGGPGQSDLHKISYNRHISKTWIFPVDSSKPHFCTVGE